MPVNRTRGPSTSHVTPPLSTPAADARPTRKRRGTSKANPNPPSAAAARAAAATTTGPVTGRTHHTSLTREANVVRARAASLHQVPRSTGWNFDWDDNIFNMPTQIRLYNKKTGETAGVSTAEFALIREQVGKSGKYLDFEMRADSLAAFGDDPEGSRNFFIEDVAHAMAASKTAWRGPSWDAFVTAMSRADTAAKTTLITARLHSPKTIHDGLLRLKELGYIAHVPPLANLYPVSYPPLAKELGGSASNPSAAKALVMQTILDKLEAEPLDPKAKPVTTPDGKGKRVMHLWGFSDDDFGNYAKAVTALSAEIKKNPARWRDVKITVFFTGKNHAGQPPRIEILTPDGGTRPARPEEIKAAVYRQVMTRRG